MSDRNWLVEELTREVQWREDKFVEMRDQLLRWKTACTYLARNACQDGPMKQLCRLMVSSMPVREVAGHAMDLGLPEGESVILELNGKEAFPGCEEEKSEDGR